MPPRDADVELLGRIDRYLDAVPRVAARAEPVGPFTLFVNNGPGWTYYARPTPAPSVIGSDDVAAVVGRQRALGVPVALEWIDELVPDLEPAARGAGLQVERHPLMHLPPGAFVPIPPPAGFELRRVRPTDDVAQVQAVGAVAFRAPGMDPGPSGAGAIRAASKNVPTDLVRFVRDRWSRDVTITVAAFTNGRPVAIGSHQPVKRATEIVGVGTAPAFRRRGLGAAVTSLLIEDALRRGVATIFLSAGDEPIARMYGRLGFVRVGTAGAAEPEAPG
ncbi:MAG: GNAT family N-acetyltransferase [Actinomycetota bacterium]